MLRRAPRPHDMRSRQQDLRCRSCCLHNAGKRLSVKTARKGALHEKSSSPARAAFFRGLDWRGVSMLHRAAIPLCNTARRQLPGVRWRCCVTSKFDIFCHLSIFFLTPGKCFSAYKHRKVPYEEGKRKFIYTGIDSDLFFFVEKMAVCLFS